MSRVMLDEAGDIDSLVTSKMSAQWDEEMRKPIEAIQEVAKAILVGQSSKSVNRLE